MYINFNNAAYTSYFTPPRLWLLQRCHGEIWLCSQESLVHIVDIVRLIRVQITGEHWRAFHEYRLDDCSKAINLVPSDLSVGSEKRLTRW